MKITVLVENTAGSQGLQAEHGLSLYIETAEHRILFDAGQSAAFADNACRLGIDLKTVDFAVLSHGHYDHGGGLSRFLEINPNAPVYLSRFAPEPHYNRLDQDIGLDPALMRSTRLRFVEQAPVTLGAVTIDPCPDLMCEDSQGLQVQEKGGLCPETFRHELYMTVQEQGRRYLFSGCSHRGAVSIARYFRPDVFVGGLHLSRVEDRPALLKIGETLAGFPTWYYTGHCTGLPQAEILQSVLGNRLSLLTTGMQITV